MTSAPDRRHIISLIDEAMAAGVCQSAACAELGLTARTLQRWKESEGVIREDRRPFAERPAPANSLSEEERDLIVATCATPEFASLPPSQIVPRLADRGTWVASGARSEPPARTYTVDDPAQAAHQLRGEGSVPGLVVGHHLAAWANRGDVLLSLSHSSTSGAASLAVAVGRQAVKDRDPPDAARQVGLPVQTLDLGLYTRGLVFGNLFVVGYIGFDRDDGVPRGISVILGKLLRWLLLANCPAAQPRAVDFGRNTDHKTGSTSPVAPEQRGRSERDLLAILGRGGASLRNGSGFHKLQSGITPTFQPWDSDV